MIFVDSNVPMYLIGPDHPNKFDAQRTLERFASQRQRLATSSEVFQEVLHRYASSDRPDMIESGFASLREIVDEVLAVEVEDVFAAKDLVHAHRGLSSRDAVHVAVMRRHGIAQILSFDRGFDTLTGIKRLPL